MSRTIVRFGQTEQHYLLILILRQYVLPHVETAPQECITMKMSIMSAIYALHAYAIFYNVHE